jgi:hypothetical protein
MPSSFIVVGELDEHRPTYLEWLAAAGCPGKHPACDFYHLDPCARIATYILGECILRLLDTHDIVHLRLRNTSQSSAPLEPKHSSASIANSSIVDTPGLVQRVALSSIQ